MREDLKLEALRQKVVKTNVTAITARGLKVLDTNVIAITARGLNV
jgi:hypothetical protein